MNMISKAMEFATKAHEGTYRKGTHVPYIVHPLEACQIVAEMTSDPEMIAAAALHDVVEDTPYTLDDIKSVFGERVAQLVANESENKRRGEMKAEDSWHLRKEETIAHLHNASIDLKIIALGDKLSNIRALHRDYLAFGDELWKKFNQKNKKQQEWYYRSLVNCFEELNGFPQWKEYVQLCDKVFKG